MSGWESVIGLEIHVQLATRSKIFSGAPTAYGAPPNSQACAVDLGLPGTLPVLNREAVWMAVRLGLAVDADIAPRSIFARKNYFYPDLPKGYQISQYELPLVSNGHLEIELEDDTTRRIGITRAHLEEDAGKSVHEGLGGLTGIDLNRAGTPLVEIVSEPELRTPAEAVAYMKKIHTLVRYLGISDGNMQEGSFRCDANVSLRRPGGEMGTRVEIKNLNSFRFVEMALEHEIERQAEILEGGGHMVQETRLYDSDKDETRSMRIKEEANDYRYFPDPDLLPVTLTAEDIGDIRASLPELPDARRGRFAAEYGLSPEDSRQLTADADLAAYFESVVKTSGGLARDSANWVTGELTAHLNRDGVDIGRCPITPEHLGRLLARIGDKTISGKIAKEIFEAMWAGQGDPDAIIAGRGLRQITDSGEIERLVDQVIRDNPEQAEQFRQGKDKVLGFLVGQVMKQSAGKANPQAVNDLMREKLRAGK